VPVPVLKYVCVGATAGDGFTIVNVENPLAPAVVGWLNGTIDGAWGMVPISETHAVGVSLLLDRFYTIDITDKTAPSIIASITAASLDGALCPAVKDNYAYVIGRRVPAFNKIDISDPTSPTLVASVTLTYTAPGGLELVENYAYIGHYGTPENLTIVDLETMTELVSLDPFASTIHGMLYEPPYVYYALWAGDGLGILDATDPTAPTVVATLTGIGVDAPIAHPAKKGDYVFLTGYLSDSFHVIDVSDPTAPVQVGSVTAVELDASHELLVANDNYAFVGAYAVDRLTVIDISDPTAPTIVASVSAVPELDGPLGPGKRAGLWL